MQINFTGIKNIGYEYRKYRETINKGENGITIEYLDPYEEIDKEDYDEDVEQHYLTLQLTDDINGKDLAEFNNKIKTSDLSHCPHPVNPKLLNIVICKEYPTEEFSKPVVSFYINDNMDELEVNDKNLAIFSYIGRLLKKISKTDDKDFVVSKDYLNKEAATSIIIGEDLKQDYGKNYAEIIDEDHSPSVVKSGAENMSEILTARMFDYLS